MKKNPQSKNEPKPQEITVSIQIPLKFNPAKIQLSVKGQRRHPAISNHLSSLFSQRSKIGERASKPRKIVMHSANVSQQKLDVEQRDLNNHIQFNKQLKSRMRNLHNRTKSNHVELQAQREDQMSDFSNSLQNISQEQIQIPFAKKKIVPPANKVSNACFKLNNFLNNGKSAKNSIEKRASPVLRIPLQRNSREKLINKQNKEKHTFRGRATLPKSKIQTQPPLCLSDFSLKAIKITQGGSIVYLAMHKKTCSIYAIKSIKKKILSANIQAFILQLKLLIKANNPNITKIYGFFSDDDNFYIIKEYLEEGCITNKKKNNEVEIGCQINQILNGINSILSFIDFDYWSLELKNIAQSQGICKITSIKVNPKGISAVFSDKLKYTLLYLLSSDRKSENIKDFLSTKQSINFNIRNGSFFINTLREIIESFTNISQSQVLLIWNTQFMRQYRYKSLMQQQK